MREYEAMVILKPELQGDVLKVSFNEILDIIKKYRCDIENVNEWGRRPLAYNIAKNIEGTYFLVKFKGEPESISEINRGFSLNENILRAMVTVQHKEKVT
ncbi:MAG: 30S ribosomal protein S6 [Candidatus Omnitrophota bacterium]|nr:MAG: 30S ribosomal protein S6 [Candidatus Omnitrophota bacterium]